MSAYAHRNTPGTLRALARFEASLLPFAFPRRRAIGSRGCAIGRAAGGSRVSRSRRTDRSSMMLISCQSPRDVPLRSGNTSGSQRAAPRGCVPARLLGILAGKSARRSRRWQFSSSQREAREVCDRFSTPRAPSAAPRRRPWVRPSGTEPCSGPCPASARTARASVELARFRRLRSRAAARWVRRRWRSRCDEKRTTISRRRSTRSSSGTSSSRGLSSCGGG